MGELEDILVDIPDNELQDLYKMYEHIDWAAPQVCCAIDCGIKWREKTKDDSMVFMSPNNSWRQDGTFILLIRVKKCYDLFVFTLDDTCKNLYNGLANTKKIDYEYKPRLSFYAVHPKHYPTIQRIAKEKDPLKSVYITCELFTVPKEVALKYEISCPPDVYVDKLKESDAEIVNEEWPHNYEGSVNTIKEYIAVNGGYGLYLKSSHELVAWILSGPLGHLALLQVLPHHKKKGYAGIMTKLLSRHIAESGHDPFGTIVVDNIASLNLFNKLGFTSKALSHYIVLINT